MLINSFTLYIRLTQRSGWLCWRRNPPWCQIPQAVGLQLRLKQLLEASQASGLLFFESSLKAFEPPFSFFNLGHTPWE